MTPVIETRGLRKEFSVRVKSGWLRRRTRVVTAVDGIDLTVERGEMVGYIGPNGAGKSTTLKMLTGVLYPSGGHVRVCGFEPVGQRTQRPVVHADQLNERVQVTRPGSRKQVGLRGNLLLRPRSRPASAVARFGPGLLVCTGRRSHAPWTLRVAH